jgi:branched-chain amino acid transport system permease protein
VLVFAVTRVIFIPQGEFVAFGALTLAMLPDRQGAGHGVALLVLAGVAALMDLVTGLRHSRQRRRALKAALRTFALPVSSRGVAIWAGAAQPAAAGAGAADAGASSRPSGPLVYRLAYQSLADASTLVLLIVSVGVHFALTGLGLLFFGAEGFRNPLLGRALQRSARSTLSGPDADHLRASAR